MTLDDSYKLNTQYTCTSTRPADYPQLPSSIVPPIDDNIAHVELPHPLGPDAFNQLSIQDAQAFHQYKDMDALHRADSVAGNYNNNNSKLDYLKNYGAENYAKNF